MRFFAFFSAYLCYGKPSKAKQLIKLKKYETFSLHHIINHRVSNDRMW